MPLGRNALGNALGTSWECLDSALGECPCFPFSLFSFSFFVFPLSFFLFLFSSFLFSFFLFVLFSFLPFSLTRLAILLEPFCKFPFWVAPRGGEGLSLGESGNSLVVSPRGGEGLSLGESGMTLLLG